MCIVLTDMKHSLALRFHIGYAGSPQRCHASLQAEVAHALPIPEFKRVFPNILTSS